LPAAATPFRRKIVRDATTEAIGLLLAENHDGLIYYADELASWLGNMDAYRARPARIDHSGSKPKTAAPTQLTAKRAKLS
jgi:hypothetical protein